MTTKPKKQRVMKAATELDEDAGNIEHSRAEILKASTYSGRRASHALPHADEAERYFVGVGAIDPPYNPNTLLTLLEHSNALRQCVDSYVTNIDAMGHRFEAVIDLNAADADERIQGYVAARRMAQSESTVLDPNKQVPVPEGEELEKAKKELRERMRAERIRLEHFFEYACLDISFVTLRRHARQDLEQQGNAYWEVVRDTEGKIAGFSYIPAFTMRHMKQDPRPVEVPYRVKTNEFDYSTVNARRHFRTYVQCFESRVVFFKEFGDPRCVDARSGAVYSSYEEMMKEDKNALRASEVIHFRVHTAKSSYGIPRWVGTLLSVLGSRHAEEVNLNYFENKSVPPLAILVQGGRMSNDSVDRIKDFVENEIKGKKNFHKILVLEAEGQGGGGFDQGKMKIDLKPLTAAQHNDALFQNYDERNIDKVGQAFRLPRMLRGDIRDFNRATADAALEFAESQVFRPERDEFDFLMNRKILPALGIRFWKFKSNSAAVPNPKDTAEIAARLGEVGFITPAEGRDIAEGIFNRQFQRIDAPWVRQPLELTKAGIVPPDQLMAPGMTSAQEAATGAGTGAAPLGGQAMAAPQANAAPATAPAGASNGTVKLTGTDLASIVTVNEARADVGRGPLMLPSEKGGGEDPDGYLTVAEFKAKRTASGQTEGQVDGATSAGVAPGTVGAPGAPPAQKSNNLLQFATELLGLRKAMSVIEAAEGRLAFEQAQAAAKSFEEQGG